MDACCIILAHVTWVGACPGMGAFHSSSQNSYMGAYPGVGACPGHYGILKLHVIKEVMIIIH